MIGVGVGVGVGCNSRLSVSVLMFKTKQRYHSGLHSKIDGIKTLSRPF